MRQSRHTAARYHRIISRRAAYLTVVRSSEHTPTGYEWFGNAPWPVLDRGVTAVLHMGSQANVGILPSSIADSRACATVRNVAQQPQYGITPV